MVLFQSRNDGDIRRTEVSDERVTLVAESQGEAHDKPLIEPGSTRILKSYPLDVLEC